MDNWKEWSGGECPVPKGAIVDIKYRDGFMEMLIPALTTPLPGHMRNATDWKNDGAADDIIAYRLKYDGNELSSWEELKDIWNPMITAGEG